MNKKTIYLAGGCFWGMQAYFNKIRGVLSTEVGYANGGRKGVTYKEVCKDSGHAEVVKVTYDEDIIATKYIFSMFIRVIDPTSINKQGEDEGIQYRTGIYSNKEKLLKKFIAANAIWEAVNTPTTIEFEELKDYTKAEKSHQEYLDKNPGGYCHINLHKIPALFQK